MAGRDPGSVWFPGRVAAEMTAVVILIGLVVVAFKTLPGLLFWGIVLGAVTATFITAGVMAGIHVVPAARVHLAVARRNVDELAATLEFHRQHGCQVPSFQQVRAFYGADGEAQS